MDAKTTGKIISTKRKEKGLTQIQLAQMLSVSNRAVSKWENGDGYPDITILPQLAQALGITIDELLTGVKPEPTVVEVERPNTSSKYLNNFKICFITSLILAVFATLLGGITEVYSIWAFPILFYTHWEIMFSAVSLVALVAGASVFAVGVIRLHLQFSKREIIDLAGKKALILTFISLLFPLTFVARIIDFSRFSAFMPIAMVVIVAVLTLIIVKIYKKISGTKNENSEKSN